MHEILSQIDEYLERYQADFIMTCKKIQQMEHPAWANSACFWLQMYDEFEDHLPFCLVWRAGAICEAESADPILKMRTAPWIPEWPEFVDFEVLEQAVEERIAQWIRNCWIRSGGRSHPMRFYVHIYSTSEEFCLLRGRSVSDEEIERDTGCD